MQKYKNVNVICPDCGRTTKVKQFSQIEPGYSKWPDGYLTEGKIFQVKCPYCGKVHSFPYSFQYHESRVNIDIYYAPDAETKEKLIEEHEDEEDVRIVDDLQALVEKIVIFHERYDDRIIEVIKHQLLPVMHQDDPDIVSADFSYNMDSGAPEPVILGITKKGYSRQMAPIREIYTRLEEDMEDDLDAYEGQTLVVDQKWAADFLKAADPDGTKISFDDDPDKDQLSKAASFFRRVDELTMEEDEAAAAELIEKDFDDVWDEMLKDNKDKRKPADLDDKYDYDFSNACNDFGMILMNEKKYSSALHVLQTMLDTLDFSDDPLMLHNTKRDYMECLEKTDGFEAELAYLDKWKQEEPDSAFVRGVEIDIWLEKDKEKALQLAEQYIDTPLSKDGDDWLYDACNNVVIETNDAELKKKLKKRGIF